MLASDVTKILNNLEWAMELCGDDPTMEHLVPDLQLLITRARKEHDNHMVNVYGSANAVRLRQTVLRGFNRSKFFQDWEWGDDSLKIFENIFSSYINWEYPCMEVFPGRGSCLKFALGAEPLYIADWDQELMNQVSAQFNEYYASKRLMQYQIKDFDLSELPQRSFGFIYSVNWMKFEDLNNIVALSRSVMQCLMPGGSYLLSYNPSDRWYGVQRMEQGFAHGADSKQLAKELRQLGFEIQNQQVEEHMTYMLLKKPGEIVPVKSSSMLAHIIDRPADLGKAGLLRYNKSQQMTDKLLDK
jgi:hypothetical protein